VLPAHDEEQRIDRTLRLYRSALTDPDIRFWVACDGCRDATADIVARHAEADPRVGWIEFPKLGKGGVLAESFRAAADTDADLIGFVDADRATPTAELLRLAELVTAGADGAIASVAASMWPAIEAGAGTDQLGDHPARLVAAASSAAAAERRERAAELLAEARDGDAEQRTYYGSALTALAHLLLRTERLGGCPPLAG